MINTRGLDTHETAVTLALHGDWCRYEGRHVREVSLKRIQPFTAKVIGLGTRLGLPGERDCTDQYEQTPKLSV